LIIAIISGVLAVILINVYLKQKEERLLNLATKQEQENVGVVVASRNISAGEVLEEGDIKIEFVPKSALQPRAVKYKSAAVGKVAAIDIVKGEQICSNKIKTPGERKETTLAMRTPAGKRAITVVIDSISAVGGMVRPGDYVDVIGNVPIPIQGPQGKREMRNTTIPLFQNVLVLAVGGQMSRNAPPPKQANPPVTLALSPQEANIISFVQEQGKIRLVLRSPADSRTEKIPPATWDTVLQYVYPKMMQQVQQTAVEEEPERKVEIYRGLRKEVISLDKEKGNR